MAIKDDYYVLFNGKTNLDLGLYWSSEDFNWETPETDFTFTSVAGVDGDFIDDNYRYKNIVQAFTFYAISNNQPLDEIKRNVSNWLRTPKKYLPLYVGIRPGYFLEAVPYNNVSFPRVNERFSKTTIEFNCLPFLKSDLGQKKIVVTGMTTLENPEGWKSQPIIKIIGSGKVDVTINNNVYTITSVDDEVTINSELYQVYKTPTQSRNVFAQFSNYEFPELDLGTNQISVSPGAKLEIIPNWRTLA